MQGGMLYIKSLNKCIKYNLLHSEILLLQKRWDTIRRILQSCLLLYGKLFNPDFMSCCPSPRNKFLILSSAPYICIISSPGSAHSYRIDYFSSKKETWSSKFLMPSNSLVSHFIFIMQLCLVNIHIFKGLTYVKTHHSTCLWQCTKLRTGYHSRKA